MTSLIHRLCITLLKLLEPSSILVWRLGQKSVIRKVNFLGDLKTPKFHSEINWPLSLWVLVHCIWYVPILLPLARKNDDKGYRRPAVYRHRELRIIYMQQKQIGCRLQNCFVFGGLSLSMLTKFWPKSFVLLKGKICIPLSNPVPPKGQISSEKYLVLIPLPKKCSVFYSKLCILNFPALGHCSAVRLSWL